MAESSRDEIAKLESMYAANPEGRVFTHLAEAYRKAGDLVRAREVLEDGLGRHSDSASGYVVLGRVMQDMGQAQEATAAFARVLELDPENRVALRALGELARAAGDTDQAMAHFRQLQVLDPSDESIEALLAELKTGPAPVAAPAAEPSPEPPPFEGPMEVADATASPQAMADTAPAELGALDIGSLSAAPDGGNSGHFDISSLSATLPAEAPHDAAAEPATDLGLPDVDAGWAGTTPEETAAWPGMGEAVLPVEGLESSGLGEEPAEEAAPLPMLEGTETTWLGAPEEGGPSESEGSQPAETPPEWEATEPTEVVTETMAELYRAQGHLDRAVEVYRALLRDRPGDEQLERKLLELELAILSPEGAAAAPPEAVAEGPQAVADQVAEPAAQTAAEAPPAEAPQAEITPEPQAETAAQPEAWTPPAQEEPWVAPVETEPAVAEATPHEELPEPWSETAAAEPSADVAELAAEAPADVAELAAEAPAELVAFEPEPVSFGEESSAEPEAPAFAESLAEPPSPEPPVAAMEAVWTSGGDVPADEPSPYDFQAPEEEVGPPVSEYLRALVAWRRSTPAEPAYAPAPTTVEPDAYDTPAGFEPAFYEPPAQEPSAFQAPAGYEGAGYGDDGPAAPAVERPAGFEAGEVEPWGPPDSEYPAEEAVEQPEALPQEWLDTPAPAPESVEAEAPWSPPPAEPTWAEAAADEPVVPEAEAPAPAGDLDWLTGPNGVAPDVPPPAALGPTDESGRGEGPTDDDDLEMFRAWLQSLKK